MSANSDGAKENGRRDASPMMILPGLLCDGGMFHHQVAAFGAQAIDDFYGDAGTLSAMADHVLDRMPPSCSLLGHSMGARVALEVWRKAPQRVERLALADTGTHPVRPGERDARLALRTLGEESGAAALVDAWLPPMLGQAALHDAHIRGLLRQMCLAAGVATYTRQIDALLNRPDAQAVLPTITCPTMILVGAEDRWSPVAQHAELADAISGSRLRIVPDAGHMAPVENPDAFNAYLCEWLAWEEAPLAMQGKGEDRT